MNLEEFIWYRLRGRCRKVLECVSPDTVIPHQYHPDPVQVFDDTDVSHPEKGLFRFVVYILWLEKQPQSFVKFLRIRDERSQLWMISCNKLWNLYLPD